MLAAYILFTLLSIFVSPAIALFMGVVLTLAVGNPFIGITKKISGKLLKLCVVGLGFGMNLHESLSAGKEGMAFTIVSVVTVMVVGVFIGKRLGVARKSSYLISSGTAICGGSAIAAIAPVIDADDSQTSLSLSVIFILNAVALFIFPTLGRLMQMTQQEFGVWAAIAIHDTSSVVGAGAAYGEEALKIATTVKLTRALWIIPLSLISALIFKSSGRKIQIPYFIFCFIGAMIINTYVALPQWFTLWVGRAAHGGLSATLFLIGAGLTKEVIKAAGVKPLLQAVILWVLISLISLAAIMIL